MKKLIITLSVVCTFLAAVGCGSPGSALEQDKWSLISYGAQGNSEQVLAGTEITAEFDSGKGQVSGSGGCNTYFASYEVDGKSLSLSDIAWTEMACLSPQGVMEQEQEVLALLAEARSFEVEDISLTITCADGSQLNFTAVPQ